MKFKKLVKGAFSKQLLKGVAAKGSLDDIVYGEYYRVLNRAVLKKKIGYKDYRILKSLLTSGRKVKEPNDFTVRVVEYLPVLFSRRKNLLDEDVKFIQDELFPYLESCQEVFKDKELETVKPLLDKVI